MARQARQLSESAIYHVMMRGINRDAIFLEDEDRQRLIDILDQVRPVSGCLVLAYCLMPNHIHLVIQTTAEPIGTVIKRLGVRYVGWFNRKYSRVGHLFQDRFRSIPVETDAYLVTLLRYVWNNPVEAGLVDRADAFQWSSRRHLGSPGPALDDIRLRQLLPADVFAELGEDATPSQTVREPVAHLEPTQRFPDHAAEQLLLRVSKLSDASEFNTLTTIQRRQVVSELRTRGVAYRQIARVTGMSNSGVRWLHQSGIPTPDPQGRPA
jgi:putative transposase